MDQGRESKVERGSEKLGLNLTWYLMGSAQVSIPTCPPRNGKWFKIERVKVERGSENLGLNLTWCLIESAQVPSPPKRKMAEDRICVVIKVVE